MRTQVKNYTFTPGTRQITVTDDITFTKSDIAVIVNRTQQKVLFTVPDYNLITDVTNKVITYDSSLPVLAENDVLWIEIDIEVTTTKIIREPAIVTVVGADYHPNDWNLTAELAAHTPNDYPYCFIIKIPKSKITELTGADAYYTSDGAFYESNQTHTWNNTADTNGSAYIIYAYATRDQSLTFLSTSTMLAIIEMLIDDLNVGMITIGNFRFNKLWTTNKTTWNDAVTRINMFYNNAIVNYVDATSLVTVGNQNWYGCTNLTFANYPNLTTVGAQNWLGCTNLNYANCPNLTSVGSGNWYNCTNLTYANYPSLVTVANINWYACTNLTYANYPSLVTVGNQNWYGCTNLTFANYPNLTTVGSGNWYNCTNLTYANYPSLVTVGNQNWTNCTNLQTLILGTLITWANNNIQNCTSLTKLVIGAETDIALDFRYGVALTVDNIRDFIVPNLKDNTGLTAKTITFATAVYNNLVAAGYIALFTARNWNVAAA